MADDRIRVEIGFDGGNAMGALVTVESVDALERALSAGSEEALALDATDGRYTVAIRRIVYVKRFAREGRLGFGAE